MSHKSRRGTAVTEMAVLLPLMVILVYGSIELANVVFLKQSITIAAYEGGRVASRAGATEAQATARVAEIMNVRDIPEFQLAFNPPVTTTTQRGTTIEITVTAPNNTFNLWPLKYAEKRDFSYTFRIVRL
jgi:Flp pilus assembly protein TadG